MPWNPVVIKKVDPKILSLIENCAWIYSHIWRIEKVNPNEMVIIKELKACLKLLLIILWWDQEIEIPEEIKITVFKRGISNGLNGLIFLGGHIVPTSMLGDNLLWKKAQKNEIKKKISEIINKIIPNFNPHKTYDEWCPWRDASREISRHHWKRVRKRIVIANVIAWENEKWRIIILLIVIIIDEIDLVNGHGLFSTMWKGWNIIGFKFHLCKVMLM